MDEELVAALARLEAPGVLILAALRERFVVLACAMDECRCPQGRQYFERKGDPRKNPWAPSADRWPVPGREGGEYVPENVRLAHARCNTSEGGKYGGKYGPKASAAANGKVAITLPEALEIRALLEGNVITTYAELADRYNVAIDTVKRIANGSHWSVRGLPRITRQAKGEPLLTSAWRKDRRGPEFESKRRAAMAAFWASPAGEAERLARAERARRQWPHGFKPKP